MSDVKAYLYDDYKMEPLTASHTVSNGFSMPVRHLHNQYEFLYVRRGRLVVESNADTIEVQGPCIVVHKPFSLHRANTQSDEIYDRYVINCTQDVLDKVLPLVPKFSVLDSHSLSVVSITPELEVMLVEHFSKIYAYTKSGMNNLATVYLALMLLTVTEYADCGHLLTTQNEGYIGEVVNYIGQNYAENIKIDQLADLFYVSRSKLIADFKRCIRVSIKQYIMLMRIYNAQRFLESGKTISETAYLCGFYDESHFVGTFHSLTGTTPRAFVKALKQ